MLLRKFHSSLPGLLGLAHRACPSVNSWGTRESRLPSVH